MIRRAFWLGTGAVLGVAGYRKASRLARLAGLRQRTAPARSWLGEAAAFASDVRTGMRLYMIRHASGTGHNLTGQPQSTDEDKDGR
jgi:hypothetical protein